MPKRPRSGDSSTLTLNGVAAAADDKPSRWSLGRFARLAHPRSTSRTSSVRTASTNSAGTTNDSAPSPPAHTVDDVQDMQQLRHLQHKQLQHPSSPSQDPQTSNTGQQLDNRNILRAVSARIRGENSGHVVGARKYDEQRDVRSRQSPRQQPSDFVDSFDKSTSSSSNTSHFTPFNQASSHQAPNQRDFAQGFNRSSDDRHHNSACSPSSVSSVYSSCSNGSGAIAEAEHSTPITDASGGLGDSTESQQPCKHASPQHNSDTQARYAPQQHLRHGSHSSYSQSARQAQMCLMHSPVFQSRPQYALNEFEPLETLGTGTFGRVLLVRLRSCPRTDPRAYFALKVLSKQDVLRLKQVMHTNNERYILSRVHHPFIVDLYCTYQDSENCYMLMEYVVGGEVFSHLRKAKRFTPDVTRFYIASLLLALAYLHSEKVLYRDLKPENLLLDRQGYIKIADFGFAKELRTQDRTWTLCGTPEYLSPEVIQSQGQTFASDYWALGVLMYEMLCGFPPFYDSTAFGTYEKILQCNIVFPKHVDACSRDLILSLLTKDVSRRLGNLKGGALDVMRHPWFEGVDWGALLYRRVPAPIVPVQAHAGDSGNFQKYSTFDALRMPALQQPQAGNHHGNSSGGGIDDSFDAFQGMFPEF